MKRQSGQLSKGERTAQRILDVAEPLFAVKGYRGTTMREIADAAGIQEPGLYNHFKGKEKLFQAMLDRALQPLASAIDEHLDHDLQKEELPAMMTELLAQHSHIPALFQQALMAPEDNPGHKLVIRWLEKLMRTGQQLIGGEQTASLDDALTMIAMFNMATGYFTAAPLLTRLTGKKTLQTEALEQQKAACTQLLAYLAQRRR